ncbi:MAG: NIPSNAP family protein [Actinomycetota bacterium]
MIYQLRSYVVKPGEMDEWLTEWREKVVPLRLKFGFEIVSAWVIEEEDRFVWIVGHDGDFAARDDDYYASPERENMDPDPARHLASTETKLMTSVLGGS